MIGKHIPQDLEKNFNDLKKCKNKIQNQVSMYNLTPFVPKIFLSDQIFCILLLF